MKAQLQQYMQENNLTQAQVATAIGKSVAVVNQYLKGTYKGKTEEVDEAVSRLMGRHQERVVERRFNGAFVHTHKAELCLDAVNTAHIEGVIAVVIGAAGLGKTQALRHYVKGNPETLLIEVDPSFNPKVLLKTLCQQLGLSETGENHDLFVRICQRLGAGRLLIVDEAELLSTKCLEYIRRIHDKTGCGLVLAGMPKLIANLRGKHGELAQLYSRSGVFCDLGNGLSLEDVGLLAESGLGTSEFNAVLFKISQGNARRLNYLMRGAIRVAAMYERPIDEQIILAYADALIK
ncbi:AAA family ATPase [Lonepinella sp. BR2474]|uniref:AAA family ATPase n=1 Tax=Lonepinella sp. BR2474 TaxID=3434548 RepID=UPI003F6E12DD